MIRASCNAYLTALVTQVLEAGLVSVGPGFADGSHQKPCGML